MLASLVVMPSFTALVEGGTYDLDDATAREYITTGHAVPVLDSPEVATIAPAEHAVMPKGSRKRG